MIYKVLLATSLIVVALLLVQTCNRKSTISTLTTLMTNERDSLYSIINSKNEVISTQEAEIVSSSSLLKKYTDSIFNLTKKHDKQIKGVIAFYQSHQHVRIDSFETAWVDTAKMKHFSDSVTKECQEVITYMNDSTIKVPATTRKDTSGLTIDMTATKKGITINSLHIIDTISVRVVEVKGGLFKRKSLGSNKRVFFKKKSYEIQTKHSSPFFTNEWQKSLIYQPTKKHSFLWGIGVGAASTIIIKSLL